MPISRRNLLRNLGVGAAATAARPSFRGFTSATTPAITPCTAVPAAGTPQDPILLYHNENPYGPSEKVLAVLREACCRANRYARTEYDILTAKLSELHRVSAEQIVLGCGSSEILRMAADTFLGPAKNLVFPRPTFPFLGDLAQRNGTEVRNVPLNKLYQHDLDVMLARVDSLTSLVYICNPNNPTGTLTPRKDIEAFIAKLPGTTTVLIDEAYHHYVLRNPTYESFLDRPIDDPRVIVSRTFSKIYGLAGMRIGYAVCAPTVAKSLAAAGMPFAISIVSAKAATAALDDVEHIRLGVKRNADDRQEFMNQVNARMLPAIDSQTNFVMLDAMRPPDEVIDHLKKHNILIAPKYPVLDKYIRVSLGLPPEMQAFWRAWDQMPTIAKTAT
jgi:histidinol-phosphate aminotransferase